MQQQNARSLESLSWICHLCGLLSVFIGMTVTLMNLMNRDFFHIQSGLFIFISGYALTKISKKIDFIVNSERQE
jgi:hypothetical protein